MDEEKLQKAVFIQAIKSDNDVDIEAFDEWLSLNMDLLISFKELSEHQQIAQFALIKYKLEGRLSRGSEFNPLNIEIERFQSEKFSPYSLSEKIQKTNPNRVSIRAFIVKALSEDIHVTARTITAKLEEKYAKEGSHPFPGKPDKQGRTPLLRRVQEDLVFIRKKIKENTRLNNLIKT